MARKSRDTGEGTPYTEAEVDGVLWELEGQYAQWQGAGEPTRIDVTARIEWAGHEMPGRGGMRRTRLEVNAGPMRAVREAVREGAARSLRAEQARPAASRRAKGWHAQLRELLEAGARGSTAADRAGLNPPRDTVMRWLRYSGPEDRAPSKANQDRIHQAYQELKEWNVRQARESAGRAAKGAAEALSAALKERYGQDVRLRDIQSFRFE